MAGLVVVTGALMSTVGPAAATASTAGDRAMASQINMRRTDLPAGPQWTSSPSTPNPPGWVATSRKAIACIQHAAGHALAVSPDPFGLGAGPVGDVTADVSSPTFAVKGPSQLPSASSEVVMTTTAMQATADLRALDTASAVPCVRATFQAIFTSEHVPAGTKLTIQPLTPPPLVPSRPRGGFRISLSGPSFGDINNEAFFYTVGRAELALSFTAPGTSFRSDWALSISHKVVARAETLLGS
ncbi:MAG: hypothetical protein ABSE77_13590 [Acidimicrobiales bacterium]